MEIVNHRQNRLEAMESNAQGNDNFAIKVISTENVEGKSSIFKKNMEVLISFPIFEVITSRD